MARRGTYAALAAATVAMAFGAWLLWTRVINQSDSLLARRTLIAEINYHQRTGRYTNVHHDVPEAPKFNREWSTLSVRVVSDNRVSVANAKVSATIDDGVLYCVQGMTTEDCDAVRSRLQQAVPRTRSR